MYKDYKGSIALHRKVRKSWIWDPKKPQYYLWWSDLLMDANWQNVEVPTENGIDVYMRGHVYRPITEYAEYWGVNRRTVTNFFRKLENSNMIRRSSNVTGTVIEIVNYEAHQPLPKDAKHTQRGTIDMTGVNRDFKGVGTQPTTQHTAQPTTQHTAQPTTQHTAHKRITNNNLTNNYINNLENNNNTNTTIDSKNTEYRTAIDMLSRCGFGNITPNTYEDVKDWIDRLNVELVLEAIKIADHAGKNFWNYPRAILRRWAQANLTTLEQVRAHENKQNYKPKQQHAGLANDMDYKPWGDLTTEKLIQQAEEEVKNMRITPDEEIDY